MDNPVEGRSLLGEDLWLTSSGFHPGVQGYLSALPDRSDWLAVRKDLHGLLSERIAQTTDANNRAEQGSREEALLDLALARRWAGYDLDAAVEWYAHEETSDGWIHDPADRTVQVLQALPHDDLPFVANWLDSHRQHHLWDDRILVDFLRSKIRMTPNPHLERLASMPESVEDRATIVEGFAKPREHNGALLLRHPPEALVSLIRAAQLPPAETARWLETVAQASWPH